MLRDIRQVLQLIKLTGKLRRHGGSRAAGGLLVLFWTDTGDSVQTLNCTVAAAGPWCAGTEIKALELDLKKSMFPYKQPCPDPDPEELNAFTDLYGSLRLLLSFQVKDTSQYTLDWKAHMQAFLQMFSLTNAGIKIHLKFKLMEHVSLHEIRVKLKRKIAQADQSSVILDVSSSALPPQCVKKGCWCRGGHPVIRDKLWLSIPPQAMDQGLFGELGVQLVTLLNPCVLQYPNLPTELTTIQISFVLDFKLSDHSVTWVSSVRKAVGERVVITIPPVFFSYTGLYTALWRNSVCSGPQSLQIRDASNVCRATDAEAKQHMGLRHLVLVYSPSNIPLPGPSGFFQTLPAALDCQQLGLDRLDCSSLQDFVHSGGTIYTVEQENWDDPEQESSHLPVEQSLLLFLFLQHSDPFISQVTDLMAAEMLIERHLEDILNNNKQAVTAALQSELGNTMKARNHRKKQQERLHSAAEVILRSTITIVSCSSNMDFRNSCLNLMKVHDTHELSASLRESLWKVTLWKFLPRSMCCFTQLEEHPVCNELTRTEI